MEVINKLTDIVIAIGFTYCAVSGFILFQLWQTL